MSHNTVKQTKPLAGVIAGTPVDTALGEQYLRELGWDVVSHAISQTPQAQNELQHQQPQLLRKTCLDEISRMKQCGAELVLIFCSSLSSVLNIAALRDSVQLPIYTPLDFYAKIANSYENFAVLAANAIGLKGAEASINAKNKYATLVGLHNISIVRQIEEGVIPEQIIKDNALDAFTLIAEKTHCECIVLACTHLPYIKSAIETLTKLPVLDINTGLLPVFQRSTE